MPGHKKPEKKLLHSWIPFGIGAVKPKHFRDMIRIVWQNRGNLRHAWRVLHRGVCDGCALGTSGLRDWTIDGTHLCLVRLELLRLNTMGGFDPAILENAANVATKTSKELRELGRLAYPLRRRRGERGFTRIGFEEVWRDVGPAWRSFARDRTAMFVTSRGITNEVYFTAQKVMRLLGSNSVDNSARLCHSPSSSGLKSTIGVAATTCSYKDWFEADLIVFLGSNPANDQPVAMKYLAIARKRGAEVVAVNAYREPGLERYWVPSNLDSALFGTNIASRFFLVKVGGDLAFLNAAAKILLANGWMKQEFIDAATTGFAAWKAALDTQPMDALLAIAGLPLSEVEDFARKLAAAERTVLVWSMGITQHAQGADTVRAIANLGLLREAVGRPGTGLMPIRGHSGVQGGAEMGAYATAFPGGVAIDPDSAARLSELWGFDVPSEPGLTCVDALDAARQGRLDGFYCVGGNFLETMPAPDRVREGLARIPLRIHTDIVLSSQMLVEPKDTVYVLPSRTRYEQTDGGTETSTERRVIFSPEIPGHVIGEARSEWEMLVDFARAVEPERARRLGLTSGTAIRQEIAKAVPFYAGIEKLKAQGDQFQWGGPMLCEDRKFPTADGKAHFVPVRPSALDRGGHNGDPLRGIAPAGTTFVLATRRGKQFNSMVQAARDPLTGAERDHVFIAPTDAARLGVVSDTRIRLHNVHGAFDGRAFLAEVAPGTLQAHWPEVNPLIAPGVNDPEGGVPDYNAEVTLEILG